MFAVSTRDAHVPIPTTRSMKSGTWCWENPPSVIFWWSLLRAATANSADQRPMRDAHMSGDSMKKRKLARSGSRIAIRCVRSTTLRERRGA